MNPRGPQRVLVVSSLASTPLTYTYTYTHTYTSTYTYTCTGIYVCMCIYRHRHVGQADGLLFFPEKWPCHLCTTCRRCTVNVEWYCTVYLPKLFSTVESRSPARGIRGLLLHHDNAPAHTTAKTLDFLTTSGVQLATHPAYSPDLTLCDHFLFRKAKEELQRRRFQTPDNAIVVYQDVFQTLSKEDYNIAFQNWFTRMQKCIDADEEYFEKQ